MSKPQPLEVISQCIGSKLWVVMRDSKQVYGKLRGYDNFFTMVIDQATVVEGADKKLSKVQSMLLNGHQIVYMVPGTYPDYEKK